MGRSAPAPACPHAGGPRVTLLLSEKQRERVLAGFLDEALGRCAGRFWGRRTQDAGFGGGRHVRQAPDEGGARFAVRELGPGRLLRAWGARRTASWPLSHHLRPPVFLLHSQLFSPLLLEAVPRWVGPCAPPSRLSERSQHPALLPLRAPSVPSSPCGPPLPRNAATGLFLPSQGPPVPRTLCSPNVALHPPLRGRSGLGRNPPSPRPIA